MAEYRSTPLTSEDLRLLNDFDKEWDIYDKLTEQGLEIAQADGRDKYVVYLQEQLAGAGDNLKATIQEIVALNVKLAEQAWKDGGSLYDRSFAITTAIVVVAVVVSVVLGLFISRAIARPLGQVTELVAKVADGDLRETVDIDRKDEIGVLARSINDMIVRLRTLVGGIVASAQSVSSASEQISASTEEIAGSSTNQAESSQMITELFKELSSAIDSVAKSSEQASELALRTVATAKNGGHAVTDAIQGMNEVQEKVSLLEQDSAKIGDIIEVIDEIAEQTNLLALNAAIEAARAGDQGRGFAVVADEVRKLAERSGEATKQISDIIKGMQHNTKECVGAVQEGVQKSKRTGDAFESIVGMVDETAQKASEIAAASEQQAAQSSDVMRSVESISAASEEAAAAAQETAATSQSLSRLAEELNGAVSRFRV
ncbi:methyl-accepting chemotaxis protein [Paenibacillus flagellatus]|uniref:methyl-accepting chemotaxis protein n=1 Tax=Paenibacillus flagellatus TaxID=2211139 RepID=UPI002482DCA0|nr:methyl-accepting chemotaxis protein [Paenibacillus flagellatus]